MDTGLRGDRALSPKRREQAAALLELFQLLNEPEPMLKALKDHPLGLLQLLDEPEPMLKALRSHFFLLFFSSGFIPFVL